MAGEDEQAGMCGERGRGKAGGWSWGVLLAGVGNKAGDHLRPMELLFFLPPSAAHLIISQISRFTAVACPFF